MKKNPLEWSVFGLSLLLILALLVYLGLKSFTYQHTPPDLEVTFEPEVSRSNQNIYRLEVVNHGEQAAENIKVEVVLTAQGQEPEKAEAHFPLAPHESTQRAWVTFRASRQADQQVQVHIVGYNQP